MNKEMHREAMLSHEVDLEIRSAGDDNQIQCDDIRYFIDQKVDLLIVSPNEADAVTPAVEEAFDAGIPVIVVDRNVHGEKYTAFIGADNEQVGYLQSQYVKSKLKPGQKIIEIKGLTGSTPSIERHRGFVSGLKDSGVEIIASVDAQWRMDVAEELTDSLLRIYPDVDMIVAQNDPMAKGAYNAATSLNLQDRIKLIGVDALPGEGLGVEAILNENLDASVLYPTGGDIVIRTALKVLKHKSFARNTSLDIALIENTNAELMSRLSDEIQHQVSIIETLRLEVDEYWVKHSAQTTLLYASIGFLFILAIMLIILIGYLKRLNVLNSMLNDQKETLEEQSSQLLALNKTKARQRACFPTRKHLALKPLHFHQ